MLDSAKENCSKLLPFLEGLEGYSVCGGFAKALALAPRDTEGIVDSTYYGDIDIWPESPEAFLQLVSRIPTGSAVTLLAETERAFTYLVPGPKEPLKVQIMKLSTTGEANIKGFDFLNCMFAYIPGKEEFVIGERAVDGYKLGVLEISPLWVETKWDPRSIPLVTNLMQRAEKYVDRWGYELGPNLFACLWEAYLIYPDLENEDDWVEVYLYNGKMFPEAEEGFVWERYRNLVVNCSHFKPELDTLGYLAVKQGKPEVSDDLLDF